MFSISIIIPVYNVEPYIQRCLDSVMSQDFSEAEIECLLIDDCGTDRSMEIARTSIKNYHGPIHFKILRQDSNRGPSAARNTGILHASNEFVFFIDSDDYLQAGSIQYFIDYARKYPNVDMIMGNTMNCKGGNLLIPTLQEPLLINEYNDFLTRMLHHQINLYVWNKLYKRQFLLEHDLLFVDGLLYEDILWTYLLFLHLRSVLILPKVTYYYEYNQSSIVNTSFFDHKADKVISSYVTNINGILDNPPCPSNLKKNVTVDYLLFMVNFLMNGVDVLNKCSIKADVAKDFLAVRLRLFTHSLGYGRLLISLFVLLLFPPLSYLQKFKFFRHHYFDIESIINIIAHFTDFLHRKDKL